MLHMHRATLQCDILPLDKSPNSFFYPSNSFPAPLIIPSAEAVLGKHSASSFLSRVFGGNKLQYEMWKAVLILRCLLFSQGRQAVRLEVCFS